MSLRKTGGREEAGERGQRHCLCVGWGDADWAGALPAEAPSVAAEARRM